ncbi:MAG: glycosyltransferase family 4 protein [Chrysiogenia bacterium]
MRVLIVSSVFLPSPGGVSTHVTNLTYSLMKFRGCKVYVVTKSRTELSHPKTQGPRLTVWRTGSKQIWNFEGRRAPFGDILDEIFLKWKTEIKADIIHVHDWDSAYIGWMLKVAFKKPLVMTLHRAPTDWKAKKYTEDPKDCFMEAIKIHKIADLIIVPSKSSRKVLLDQSFSKNTIRIIKHGIAYKYLRSFGISKSVEALIPKGYDMILCPIRADKHKDPLTFIMAASILKKKYPDKKFFFVLTAESDGIYQLKKYASDLDLTTNDILIKKFDYHEMPSLYRLAKICVIPSPRESFGQTILEAFSFSKPVIAANSAALKELINHEKNGLHFNVNDPNDLVYQIERLLDDPKLVQKLIKKGDSELATKYTTERMANSYYKIYQKLINSYKKHSK